MAKKVERWFEAGKKLGWQKTDSQSKRRTAALSSRRGNYLATARALLALANVTRDVQTAKAARSDAKYFFMKHRLSQKKKDKR